MDAQIQLCDTVRVTVVQVAGDDQTVVGSARVSTGHEADQGRLKGTIKSLMSHGHYSPSEHSLLTVDCFVPNFVAKELIRHRHLSPSEFSQRYSDVPPIFWAPAPWRKTIEGPNYTPMRPELEMAAYLLQQRTTSAMRQVYQQAYDAYLDLRSQGIAREVARAMLPGAVFTTIRLSGNLRAWLHFLALRTHDADAVFVSYPQREIEDVARAVEQIIRERWPLTYRFWDENGRIPT